MCYLTNQWITYNLPINIINAQALTEAIYITFFYMYVLAAHVKNLYSSIQNGQLHHRLVVWWPHLLSRLRDKRWAHLTTCVELWFLIKQHWTVCVVCAVHMIYVWSTAHTISHSKLSGCISFWLKCLQHIKTTPTTGHASSLNKKHPLS